MDETRIYAKMCIKAVKLQEEHDFEKGDYILCEPPGDVLRAPIHALCIHPETHWKGHDICLFRQDQLQEMIQENPSPKLLVQFIYFLGWDGATFSKHGYPMTKPPEFTSLEQLWLAFVMKEKYNKVWDSTKGDWM